MTKKFRLKIAYWFFLFVGMLGVIFQMYKYLFDKLELNFQEGALTVFFGMFIFKPMLILDLFDDIRVKFLGAKRRMFKTESDKNKDIGGEAPDDPDAEV